MRQQAQKLLSGFCALPGQELIEKIFLGGIEVVILSLKTKLVTVSTAVVLGFGGASVWHWHTKPAPKPTVVQQEVRLKKLVLVPAKRDIGIPKLAPKTASRKQPAKVQSTKPPVQAEGKQEEILDEEWTELEQWLDEMEQYNEQNETDELTKESEAESEPEWITQARRELDKVRRMERYVDRQMKELSSYLQNPSLSDGKQEELVQKLQTLFKQDAALIDRMNEIKKIIKEYEESK